MTGNYSDLSLEVRIKNLLQRISNFLLLNVGFIDNPGLLNGKIGIAMFFCQKLNTIRTVSTMNIW